MEKAERKILDNLQNYLPKTVINSITDEIKKEFTVVYDGVKEGFQFYSRKLNLTKSSSSLSTFVSVEIGFEQVLLEKDTEPEGFYVTLSGTCSNGKTVVEDKDYVILGQFRHKTQLSDLVKMLEDLELTDLVYSEIEKFIECLEEKVGMEKSA